MSATQAELLAIADQVLVKNYRQAPFVLAHGKGAELWDCEGKRYLDMTSGIAVCGLGHAHPGFTSRIAEQATRLIHTSNLFFNDQQILAAQAISRHAFGGRVFFANSGAEANEAALKLARRYQTLAGKPERTGFVSTVGSFHGRSFATVAVTGQKKYRESFGPLVGPVEFVPYGDVDAMAQALRTQTAAAVIVEPIQAEGGIVVAPPGYLAALRKLCDETDTLLIFDEVQTGMGRTGTWFAHEHAGVTPDVMTLAKGLGGGVPVGAIVCQPKAADALAFKAGGAVVHANTFGGNPLACAAICAVFDMIEQEGLLANVQRQGDYLGAQLAKLVADFPGHAISARGQGLLRGLEVAGQPADVTAACRNRGLLLSVAGDKVVRFAPAFIVSQAQVDEAIAILRGVLAEGIGKA